MRSACVSSDEGEVDAEVELTEAVDVVVVVVVGWLRAARTCAVAAAKDVKVGTGTAPDCCEWTAAAAAAEDAAVDRVFDELERRGIGVGGVVSG